MNQNPEPSNGWPMATSQAGAAQPSGMQTSVATPKPMAMAAEPQDPEPWPAKLREGLTAAGQAVDGKTKSSPADAATDWTTTAERRANAPRPIGPKS